MLNENDLKNYLKEKGIVGELIKFENSVIKSEEAFEATKGTIVKSILLKSDKEFIICILLGKDKINLDKIKEVLNAKEIRLAKAKEVLEVTGYDIGSLPPFSHKNKIKKIVDKKVFDLKEGEFIFVGGGSHYHLLKIKKEELVKGLEDFIVENISE